MVKCMAEGSILMLMETSTRGSFITDSSGGSVKLLIFPTPKSKPMKDR